MKKIITISLLAIMLVPFVISNQKKTANTSIEAFRDSWNETNNALRLEKIRSYWHDGSKYVDKTQTIEGVEGIDNLINGFQEKNPDAVMRIDSLTTFMNYYAWYWNIQNGTSEIIQNGYNYAELDEEGKFIRIISFKAE